jgi:amidohydrolase family protein
MARSFLTPFVLASLVALVACSTPAQMPQRQPVIDAHVHLDVKTGPSVMESLNVRYWVLTLHNSDLRDWAKLEGMSHRYLPSLSFPCPGGRAVIFGEPCDETLTEFPDITWLRGELRAGRIKALGEMLPQYMGLAPGDPQLEPYWALSEEFDIPAAIHMGPGPPGAAYESSPAPVKHPNYRMAYGDPILLEKVLLRHKRLRLSVMHAGWPRLESMIALLYAHPNVYVDTGGLHSDRIVPRAAYYRYLQSLVESGFGKRIMFASDFPDQIGMGIDAIRSATFLTPEQKADILCSNAARFLRLDATLCQPG